MSAVQAVLIGSSARSDPANGVHPREKADESEKGDLRGTVMDVAAVYDLLINDLGVCVMDKFDSPNPQHTNLSNVSEAIKRRLQEAPADVFVYYSGHGRQDGAWCFDTASHHTPEFITPSDIEQWIKTYKRKTGKVIIVSDSCFSGKWATRFRDVPGVYVQAAAGPNEFSVDTRKGGIFTQRWVGYCCTMKDYQGTPWNLVNPFAYVSTVTATANCILKVPVNYMKKSFTPTINFKKDNGTSDRIVLSNGMHFFGVTGWQDFDFLDGMLTSFLWKGKVS